MPVYMSHFESDFECIIEGTYSQIYQGKNIKDYAVYKIDNGKITNNISWYQEDQLTLLEYQDADKAELMIENYNLDC